MKLFYTADDLKKLLGVSASKAYDIIKALNCELQNAGYMTVRGKVPAAYVEKRFFGIRMEEKNE